MLRGNRSGDPGTSRGERLAVVKQPEQPLPRPERRFTCTACGAQDAVPLRLPPPADGVVLCPEHASQLANAALGFIAEMQAKQTSRTTLYGRRLHDGEAIDAIRAWAIAAGYPVCAQGSISAPIIAAYRQAAIVRGGTTDPAEHGRSRAYG